MTSDERKALLEDEVIILQDSGEIPEIAYHSTLHYLMQDPEGPEIILSEQELHLLQDAAIARYQEIILRDITPENRDLSLYRGVRRTICNWQRLEDFCSRINRDSSFFKGQVGRALLSFLQQEVAEIETGDRESTLNGSQEMIAEFAARLGLELSRFPDNWQAHCLAD